MDVKRKKPFVSLASFSPKPPNQKDGEVRLSGSFQCTECLFIFFGSFGHVTIGFWTSFGR
jgi:hypothetical protein